MLVIHDMIMGEVVEEYPSLIPVINRFGIRLGLGDKSVKEICLEHDLDTDFLLTVVNTFLNEDYFPEKKLQSFHESLIVDYLKKTCEYYIRHQLPNIERHLKSLLQYSNQGNQMLALIAKFFSSFKEELLKRIDKYSDYSEKTLNTLGEDSLDELLADMKRLIVRHLSGEYDVNLCYAVIFSIHSLEKDIKQNNRICSRILQQQPL